MVLPIDARGEAPCLPSNFGNRCSRRPRGKQLDHGPCGLGLRIAHPVLHSLEYRHAQPETNCSRRAVRCCPQLRGGMPQWRRRRGCRRARRWSSCSRWRSRRLRCGAPHEGQATAQGRHRCSPTARRRSQCADWALTWGILSIKQAGRAVEHRARVQLSRCCDSGDAVQFVRRSQSSKRDF